MIENGESTFQRMSGWAEVSLREALSSTKSEISRALRALTYQARDHAVCATLTRDTVGVGFIEQLDEPRCSQFQLWKL